MGIQLEAAFTDDATGIVLANGHASFKISTITIQPDAWGIHTLSAAAGIWKDKDGKTGGKAPLTYVNVTVKATPEEMGKEGVYNMLYGQLKAQLSSALIE